MKYKYNGQWYDVSIKALDSMPVGTIVEYDGQASDIPTGWEQVTGQNKIKKTSETTPTMASIVDGYNTSTQNGYSCNYVNNAIPAIYDNYSASDSDGYSCNYANSHFGGVVLYNNTNGELSEVTLSSSTVNFSYIEIYYQKSGCYGYTKVFEPNGKQIALNVCNIWQSTTYQNIMSRWTISGNKITKDYEGYNSQNGTAVTTSNELAIMKVVGYN